MATPTAEPPVHPGRAGPRPPEEAPDPRPRTAPPAPVERAEAAGDATVLPAAGRRLGRHRRPALGLVVPLRALGVWAWASGEGVISTRLLPGPGTVAEATWQFFFRHHAATLPGVVPFEGAAARHLSASATRWLVAYALAVGVGLPLGLGIGLSRLVADLLDPIVQALRAIPIFAWLPLALVWFGLGEGSSRYLVFIGALWPIVVATADSVSRVPRAYVETALMLGTPHRALAHRVYLPAALPGIVTGLRLGLTLGWMSVIVGELTGAPTGLGAMMNAARESGHLDQVMVGMLCFAVVGLAGDLSLRAATRRLVAWNDR